MATTPEMVAGLVNQFNTEIYMQLQQKLSKTRPYVDVITITKEQEEIDNIGGVKFVQVDGSFVEVSSVKSDITYAKRLVSAKPYYLAHEIDIRLANMLAPNSSKYIDKVVQQIVNQYQFNIDKTIYEAMDANAKAKDGTAITFANDGGVSIDLKTIATFIAANISAAKQKLTAKGFGINDDSGLAWMLTDVETALMEKDTSITNMDYQRAFGVKMDDSGSINRIKGIDLLKFASVGMGEQKPFFYSDGSTLDTHYRKTFMFNTNKNTNGQSAITLGIRKECITDIF